jgi:uncharacterized membrane protein
LLAAIFPAMYAANELLSQLATIEAAYNDIAQAYPAVMWIMAILLVLLVVCFTMFLLERRNRRNDRKNEVKSLSASQSIRLRQKIRQELQAELKTEADDLKRQTAELARREHELKQEACRLHCREQQVIAKQAELEKQQICVANKSDQFTLWLSQVECAIEAMVEDHDTTGKISVYLTQWVDMAVNDPPRFIAEVSTAGKFDTKRFDRSKRQLSNIYDRYAEIRQAMVDVEKALQGGNCHETGNSRATE